MKKCEPDKCLRAQNAEALRGIPADTYAKLCRFRDFWPDRCTCPV